MAFRIWIDRLLMALFGIGETECAECNHASSDEQWSWLGTMTDLPLVGPVVCQASDTKGRRCPCTNGSHLSVPVEN